MEEVIYLVIFEEGMDVHKMNECPSQNSLDHDDVVYIRISKNTDEIKLEHYSTIAKSWVEVTP
jgi:hypothetical protein